MPLLLVISFLLLIGMASNLIAMVNRYPGDSHRNPVVVKRKNVFLRSLAILYITSDWDLGTSIQASFTTL